MFKIQEAIHKKFLLNEVAGYVDVYFVKLILARQQRKK